MKRRLLLFLFIILIVFLSGCNCPKLDCPKQDCPQLDCSKCPVTQQSAGSNKEGTQIGNEPLAGSQNNDNKEELLSAKNAMLKVKDLDEIFAFENRPDDARWKTETGGPTEHCGWYECVSEPGIKSHLLDQVFIRFSNTRTLEPVFIKIDEDVAEYYYIEVAKKQFEAMDLSSYKILQTEVIGDMSYVVTSHYGPETVNGQVIEANTVMIYFLTNNLKGELTYRTEDMNEDFVSTGITLAKRMISKAKAQQ